jgi:hypothetical protein
VFVVRIDSHNANPDRYSDVSVDSAKGFSVIREARYIKGAEYWRVEIDLENRHSEWVPKRWRIISSDPNGVLDAQDEFEVTHSTFNEEFASSYFRQERKPGMVVKDLQKDRRYVVGLPGERDVPVEELASRRSGYSASLLIRVAVIAAILATAFAARVLYHRLQK